MVLKINISRIRTRAAEPEPESAMFGGAGTAFKS